jgi:hypothetical protein
MKLKGALTGCSGDAFTTVKYTATLTSAGPVGCAALRGAGSARFLLSDERPANRLLSCRRPGQRR